MLICGYQKLNAQEGVSRQRALEKIDLLMEHDECGARSDASYYFETLGKLRIQAIESEREYSQLNTLENRLHSLTEGHLDLSDTLTVQLLNYDKAGLSNCCR